MKFIGISFTLKGQDFQKDIVPALEEIAGKYKDDDVTLLHGFMPKEVVEQKGFSTDVVDKLNELFPNQKSFYVDGSGPDRNALKNELYNNIATVFVIGKIIDGVKEEVILYFESEH